MLIDNRIFNFFVQAFENDKYEEVKNFLEGYKIKVSVKLEGTGTAETKIQKALDDLICLNKYDLIKWAAENGDIEALLLLKDYLSSEELYKALVHNNYEAFSLFITSNKAATFLGMFDQEVFEEGLKFFKNYYSAHYVKVEELKIFLDTSEVEQKIIPSLDSSYIEEKLSEFIDVLGDVDHS